MCQKINISSTWAHIQKDNKPDVNPRPMPAVLYDIQARMVHRCKSLSTNSIFSLY